MAKPIMITLDLIRDAAWDAAHAAKLKQILDAGEWVED